MRRYLFAEMAHALGAIEEGDTVLDLGCGYGRTLPALSNRAARVTGIDSSADSLRLACERTAGLPNCTLAAMSGHRLGFATGTFDVVLCIQNGISAFHVDRVTLVCEAVRVARAGGLVLFSTYSMNFWDARLEWFVRQSKEGLLGEIDWERTGDGVIRCKDGFEATTPRPEELLELAARLCLSAEVREVDRSSVFLEISK